MTVKEQRQREWGARVTDFKASGMTMPAWCLANQVNLNQMKYWNRNLKKVTSSLSRPTKAHFVPLSVSAEHSTAEAPSLVVQVGSASIGLQKGFDPELLREVVEALSPSC